MIAIPSGVAVATGTEPAAASAALWQGVDRLVDRAPSVADLRAHKLHMLALARYRATRREVPVELHDAVRDASLTAMAAPLLLRHIRELVDGPLVLLKGPELAARYPEPWQRPFGDLDLLVRDPIAVQRALLANGFTLVGDERLYVDIHHLRPLHYGGFPLVVEVHARPKWLETAVGPPVDDIFEAAVPAAFAVEGLLAPAPAHHALLVAAHSWAHAPLGQLLNLVDVAALRAESSEPELAATARAWNVERLWRATDAALDAVLFGERRPWPLRVWARNLDRVRHRTVLETHLERWLAAFCVLPFRPALAAGLRAVGRDLRPAPGESWRLKLRRTRRAFANAFVRRSEHDRELELIDAGERRDSAP